MLSVTGSRADYGVMEPVHRSIIADPALALDLIVTGMHFVADFASSLAQVRKDKLGALHDVPMLADEDSGKAMAQSISKGLFGMAAVLDEVRPDILLVQGDRGEMLAGAIAAAHMNIPIVHMSGGDASGSIDNSVRNAISKFAHFHLTNCATSTQRLLAMGEAPERILEVGEPALDRLRSMAFVPLETLAAQLDLPRAQPFLMAALHPVIDEADAAADQIDLLEALEQLCITTVFTYPNTDYGGRAMRDVLKSWRGRPFLRIEANLGSQRYLSLLRHAAALVGNSSSGIFDSPSFKIPAINVGSRQDPGACAPAT